MDRYNVKGMSCAACVARVERAVNALDGIENVEVSLLTNSMTVEGTTEPSIIIEAVKKAGYKAIAVKKEQGSVNAQIDYLKQHRIHINSICQNTIFSINAVTKQPKIINLV